MVELIGLFDTISYINGHILMTETISTITQKEYNQIDRYYTCSIYLIIYLRLLVSDNGLVISDLIINS